MASTDNLPAAIRDRVKKQTAPLLRAMLGAAAGPARKAKRGGLGIAPAEPAAEAEAAAAPKLAEDFVLCILSLEDVLQPPDNPQDLLRPKGFWLHLLRDDDKATHFTISESRDHEADDPRVAVHTLTEGDLPDKIFQAALHLDEVDAPHSDRDEDLVRVIWVPPLYTYALAVLRPEGAKVIVLSMADGLDEAKKKPPADGVPFATFLKQLAALSKKMGLSVPKLKPAAVKAAKSFPAVVRKPKK